MIALIATGMLCATVALWVVIANALNIVAAWHSLRHNPDPDDPNGFRACQCPACKGWS